MKVSILLILLTCSILVSCQSNEDKLLGVDHKGVTRNCQPMAPGTVCTEIFTEADAFAMKCQDDGHKAIQCGCHDWICIKK